MENLSNKRGSDADARDTLDKFDWRVVSSVAASGERQLSVHCDAVDVLVARLEQLRVSAEPELEESGIMAGQGEAMMNQALEGELGQLFAEALRVCPELLDCEASWCQHWNATVEVWAVVCAGCAFSLDLDHV